MTANITANELWNNPSLMPFFMTEQAQNQLRELCDKYGVDTILTAIDETYTELDELAEDLHHLTENELLEMLSLSDIASSLDYSYIKEYVEQAEPLKSGFILNDTNWDEVYTDEDIDEKIEEWYDMQKTMERCGL